MVDAVERQVEHTRSGPPVKCPNAFRYWEARDTPLVRGLERVFTTVTRQRLFPSDEQASALCEDLFTGDPVAERFVAEVMHGAIGSKAGRAMLETALAEGIDAVPDAPESMRALFAEFETVPDWVVPELVEQGAAIWRRWGTMLFSFAGAETLEMYTEAAVATPLSLAGGYAGDSALRRFLETTRFWIDVSAPDALLTPGSAGRATALKVRVMHVSVRAKVAGHPEWDLERWGLPISQTYQMLTLLAGSVTPGLGLWALGYQTTPSEIRALLHFQKYMGHLLGVRVRWYPETVLDGLRVLAMTIVSRSYDAGQHGTELIESYPAAFAPRDGHRGLTRWREKYNYRINSVYSAMYMAPGTRRHYTMPPAFPWILIPILRFPLITAMEIVRRICPPFARAHEKLMLAHRENWYRAQMQGRTAAFDASGALRR
ncbi:oxygenase MpaB family protein [Nocardia salmonicida]|uniref:oxygenase MpaB family protein n=1 Tax=Nocardia salmonicida TaxID=53431 RepID=UPI000AA4DDBE|nr:oxygenase MpaB family protein [Nocardia salmonicida]